MREVSPRSMAFLSSTRPMLVTLRKEDRSPFRRYDEMSPGEVRTADGTVTVDVTNHQ